MQTIPYYQTSIFWLQAGVHALLTTALLAIFRFVWRSTWIVHRPIDQIVGYSASALIVSSGYFLEPVLAELINILVSPPGTAQLGEFATLGALLRAILTSLSLGFFPGLILGFLVMRTGFGRSGKSAAAAGVLVLIGSDIVTWGESHFLGFPQPITIFGLVFSICCDFWGGPVAGIICRWVAARIGALPLTAKDAGGISNAEPGDTAERATVPSVVMNRVIFLTGIIGYYWLAISWFVGLIALALIIISGYFAIFHKAYAFPIEMFILAPPLLLICGGMRLIARGFLGGRKGAALIGCAIMLLFAAGVGYELSAGWFPIESTVLAVLEMLAPLVLATLLIATFQDRHWRGRRG